MRKAVVLLLFIFNSLPVFASVQNDKGNIVFELKNADSVLFSHEHHTKDRGVKCQACHYQTFSAGAGSFQMKRDKVTKREFCGLCHNGLKAFDADSEKNCVRCHRK